MHCIPRPDSICGCIQSKILCRLFVYLRFFLGNLNIRSFVLRLFIISKNYLLDILCTQTIDRDKTNLLGRPKCKSIKSLRLFKDKFKWKNVVFMLVVGVELNGGEPFIVAIGHKEPNLKNYERVRL